MSKALGGIFILVCLIVFVWPKGSHNDSRNNVAPQSPPAIAAVPAPEIAATLNTYMYEGFGGCGNPKYATSWYSNIRSIEATRNASGTYNVDVRTDIYIDGDAPAPANAIASAILFSGKIPNTSLVTVYGIQNGQSVALCQK